MSLMHALANSAEVDDAAEKLKLASAHLACMTGLWKEKKISNEDMTEYMRAHTDVIAKYRSEWLTAMGEKP